MEVELGGADGIHDGLAILGHWRLRSSKAHVLVDVALPAIVRVSMRVHSSRQGRACSSVYLLVVVHLDRDAPVELASGVLPHRCPPTIPEFVGGKEPRGDTHGEVRIHGACSTGELRRDIRLKCRVDRRPADRAASGRACARTGGDPRYYRRGRCLNASLVPPISVGSAETTLCFT